MVITAQQTQTLNPYAVYTNYRNSYQAALVVESPPATAGDIRDSGSTLAQKGLLEEERATYSSIHAWRIPQTGEFGGLQSMVS